MDVLQEYPFYLTLPALLMHVGTFLVIFVLLKAVLFDPLLRLINDRNEEIDEGFSSIEEKRAQLSARIQEFESRMEERREEATREMQEIVSEGEERRTEIVSEAHEKALQILEGAREEVKEETEKAKEEIQEHTASIAARMANQVSGATVKREQMESFLQDVS